MIKEAARLILASRAADPVRRRRHLEGPCGRGAARAGRADRDPRGHHVDGPRRVPRQPSAVPRHAGHARQRHRGHGDAARRPADRPRAAASTTGSPGGSAPSPPTPRSSMSTSTPRSWARSAARRSDRRRLPAGHRADGPRGPRRHGGCGQRRATPSIPWPLELAGQPLAPGLPAAPTTTTTASRLKPQYVSSRTCATPAPDDTIVVCGVGSTRCGRAVLEVRPPLHLGQLRWPRDHGFLGPRRHRGKVGGWPDKLVWAVDGDGCFQMTAQELVTARPSASR